MVIRPDQPAARPAAAVLPFALFGIDNSGIGVAANLLIVFLVAVWLALAYWAWSDARRRVEDPVLVISAALAALIFPFAGALVYAIVRPPETLEDTYERDLDVRAAELRVRLLESAVRGGPGSDAHAASLSAELTGEAASRRGGEPESGRQQSRQQPARSGKSGQPARSGKSAEPARGGKSTQGKPAQGRGTAKAEPGRTSVRGNAPQRSAGDSPSRPSGRDR